MRERQDWSAYMRYRSSCPEKLLQLLWDRPDRLIQIGELLIRKRCVRTTVRVSIEDKEYVVKRWLERSAYHAAKQLVLPSRAALCWRDTHFLLTRGVCTPRPLAYRENRWGPLRGISYLVYPYVPGRTLTDVLRQGVPPLELGLRLARQLVRTLRQIATARTSHNDSSGSNFVVEPSGRLWVIDLDKLQYYRWLRTAMRRYRDALGSYLPSSLFTPEVVATIRREPGCDALAAFEKQLFPRKPLWHFGRQPRRQPAGHGWLR